MNTAIGLKGHDSNGHDSFGGLRRPGRPSNKDGSHVLEDIIQAMEISLEHKSSQEMSVKEIALMAGTRPAMVYYYFGSREGLLVEITRRYLNELQQGFKRIRDAVRGHKESNPTRLLLTEFANYYNQHLTIIRMLISETFREDSEVLGYLHKQTPAYDKLALASVIAELSAEGYYRKDLDIEKIYMLINSVVLFPLILKPYFNFNKDRASLYLDDKWIDFVSSVLDSYLHKSI